MTKELHGFDFKQVSARRTDFFATVCGHRVEVVMIADEDCPATFGMKVDGDIVFYDWQEAFAKIKIRQVLNELKRG